MKLEFCRLSKNTLISDYMKIRPVGAELFHAEGQTDIRKLIVAFRNFATAPRNLRFYVVLKQKYAVP